VYAHEELVRRRVTELLQVQNVELMLGQKSSDGVHNTRLVRAGKCQVVVVCL